MLNEQLTLQEPKEPATILYLLGEILNTLRATEIEDKEELIKVMTVELRHFLWYRAVTPYKRDCAIFFCLEMRDCK